MKMPEPIIEPMTSVVALVRPSPFTNSFSPEARETVFVSVLKKPLGDARGARKNLHQQPQEFFRGLGRGTQQVRDQRHRIGAGVDDRTSHSPRVIPPIATNGLLVAARAARTPSIPTTGSWLRFDEVAKHRPKSDVVGRPGVGFPQLFRIVGGDSQECACRPITLRAPSGDRSSCPT